MLETLGNTKIAKFEKSKVKISNNRNIEINGKVEVNDKDEISDNEKKIIEKCLSLKR